jgi:hypothetical protein
MPFEPVGTGVVLASGAALPLGTVLGADAAVSGNGASAELSTSAPPLELEQAKPTARKGRSAENGERSIDPLASGEELFQPLSGNDIIPVTLAAWSFLPSERSSRTWLCKFTIPTVWKAQGWEQKVIVATATTPLMGPLRAP